ENKHRHYWRCRRQERNAFNLAPGLKCWSACRSSRSREPACDCCFIPDLLVALNLGDDVRKPSHLPAYFPHSLMDVFKPGCVSAVAPILSRRHVIADFVVKEIEQLLTFHWPR